MVRNAGALRASSASSGRALADLLLVDDNPLDDIHLIADPERNFVVIMKHGRIYKNTLPRPSD